MKRAVASYAATACLNVSGASATLSSYDSIIPSADYKVAWKLLVVALDVLLFLKP